MRSVAAWFQSFPRPVVALDRGGTVAGFNPAALALLELTADQLDGQPFAATALGPDARGPFGEVLAHALGGHTWTGELPVSPGGARDDFTRHRPVQLSAAPVREGGEVIGVLLSVESLGDPREAAAHLAERFARLARVAGELQSAANVKALGDVVVTHLADAAGATTAALAERVADDTIALVALRGGTPGAASRWATFPLDESTPAGVALLAQRPMLYSGREAIRGSFPDLELVTDGERSILSLPLVVTGNAIGAVMLSFPSKLSFDENEMEFFRIMADTCAQALDRIRALETVADQHEKLRFLAEASAELASSLDYESTLRNIAWLAVPGIADWCSIQLEQDGTLRQLAVAHRDPDKIALAEQFQELYPTDPSSDSGAYGVLRSGESQLVPEVTDEMIVAAAVDDRHLEMIRSLDLKSALTVPLKTRDRTLGVIAWVSGSEGKRFGPGDVPFGEDFARRAATAIDNAQLHSELRDIADQLQQAVLPPQLPEIAGWRLASTYSSAGRVDVGGDFYDVTSLRDGRVSVAIGDVMGRGVDAAAAMAQIRAALRAFVAVDPEPEAVLHRLDVLYETFPTEQLVTMLYAVADPGRDDITLVNAGHPSPLLRDEHGTLTWLDDSRGTMLGVGPAARVGVSVPLLEGQTVLFFTDGLVERRDEDLDVGRARLVEEVRALPQELTNEDLAALAARTRDPSRDDDVAVLAVTRVRSTVI
jgi:GAF domain-containing protein